MAGNDNFTLTALCGIYCGQCPVNKAKDDPKIMEYLISRGFKQENLPCPGCRSVKGYCPAIGGAQCATYLCAEKHEVDFCYQCPDFPCAKLNPAADRANILPHNIKVFNLCYIKEQGLEKFIEEAPQIQNRYYKGKMQIGRGPQID